MERRSENSEESEVLAEGRDLEDYSAGSSSPHFFLSMLSESPYHLFVKLPVRRGVVVQHKVIILKAQSLRETIRLPYR